MFFYFQINVFNIYDFRRSWTKVHQIEYKCKGQIAVCNAVFRSTISCFVPEIFATKLQSCPEVAPKFGCSWAPNFCGGAPNF